MYSLDNLTIDRFLPLQRMEAELHSAHDTYMNAKPYPHIVFDNFFDQSIVDRVLDEFPKPGEIAWQEFNNTREIKLASAKEASFGPVTRLLLYHLNSMTFLDFLGRVTGIPGLISDPGFEGGGLHQIVRGGKLGVHADFNRHRTYRLDRRLNLLLYLNKDWREEFGGNLELWNREKTNCEAKILPIFNRVMIFGTTDFTYHGHPDPLRCPEGWTRKSLALYYFSNGRPAEEVTDEHSTLFHARNAEDFRPTVGQRARALVAEIVPPIVFRGIRFLRRKSPAGTAPN